MSEDFPDGGLVALARLLRQLDASGVWGRHVRMCPTAGNGEPRTLTVGGSPATALQEAALKDLALYLPRLRAIVDAHAEARGVTVPMTGPLGTTG